jgi:ribosomal protein L37E
MLRLLVASGTCRSEPLAPPATSRPEEDSSKTRDATDTLSPLDFRIASPCGHLPREFRNPRELIVFGASRLDYGIMTTKLHSSCRRKGVHTHNIRFSMCNPIGTPLTANGNLRSGSNGCRERGTKVQIHWGCTATMRDFGRSNATTIRFFRCERWAERTANGSRRWPSGI